MEDSSASKVASTQGVLACKSSSYQRVLDKRKLFITEESFASKNVDVTNNHLWKLVVSRSPRKKNSVQDRDMLQIRHYKRIREVIILICLPNYFNPC